MKYDIAFKERVPKRVYGFLNEYDADRFQDVRLYINYLKNGADDGWMKTSNKEYKAILWMHENKEKCADYIKVLEGVT